MEKITFQSVGNSIPVSSMPLERNFISIESRLESYKNYKGPLDKKYLAVRLGRFYDEKMNRLFCFNCGHSSPLNSEGTIRGRFDPSSTLYHFNLCTLMQSQNEMDETQVHEELSTNVEVEKCKDNTQSVDKQEKDIKYDKENEENKNRQCTAELHELMDKCQVHEELTPVVEVTNDKSSIEKQENDIEENKRRQCTSELHEHGDDGSNSGIKLPPDATKTSKKKKKKRFLDPKDSDDENMRSDEEDSGPEGWLWDCTLCGMNESSKLINMPCRHMTYCVHCSKRTEKCAFCEEEITHFMPIFM